MRQFVSILLCCCLLGCASKNITLETVEPAPAHEVTQLRRMAVVSFRNDSRGVVAASVENALSSVRLFGKQYFTIVDLKGKGYFLEPQGMEMTFDAPALGEYGRKAGADGVLLATVTRNGLRDIRTHEQRPVCISEDESGNCKKLAVRKVPCMRREGTFTFIPKVVESRTGQIIYSAEFSEAEESSACYGDSEIPPSGEELLATARDRAIARFVGQVAPHRVRMSISLLTEDDSGIPEATKVAIDNGVAFARENRLDRACTIWSEAARAHPQGYALPYLLGVCEEASGRLEQAQSQYTLADQRTSRPVDEISVAQARVRKALASRAQLLLQTH